MAQSDFVPLEVVAQRQCPTCIGYGMVYMPTTTDSVSFPTIGSWVVCPHCGGRKVVHCLPRIVWRGLETCGSV